MHNNQKKGMRRALCLAKSVCKRFSSFKGRGDGHSAISTVPHQRRQNTPLTVRKRGRPPPKPNERINGVLEAQKFTFYKGLDVGREAIWAGIVTVPVHWPDGRPLLRTHVVSSHNPNTLRALRSCAARPLCPRPLRSAVGVLEGQLFLERGTTQSLSVEQLLVCVFVCAVCGWVVAPHNKLQSSSFIGRAPSRTIWVWGGQEGVVLRSCAPAPSCRISRFTRPKDVWGCSAAPEKFAPTAFVVLLLLFLWFPMCVWGGGRGVPRACPRGGRGGN